METVELNLHPSTIPEWEAEDLMISRLANDTVLASEEQAKAMLKEMRLTLPLDIVQTELVGYAVKRKTPLSLEIPSDSSKFNFYLIEVPLNILVPEDQRLVRLRLKLDLRAEEDHLMPIVAYDLFPPDQWEEKLTSLGEVNIDVSKMLTFIWQAPIVECLGFKLKLPIRWKSRYVRFRTTDRMSNPVEWYVTDQAIENGFTGYAVIRAPKETTVIVEASLACELRKSGPLRRLLKARYLSDVNIYKLEGV